MIAPCWPPQETATITDLLMALLELLPPTSAHGHARLLAFPTNRWPALRTALRALTRRVLTSTPPVPPDMPWPDALTTIFPLWARQATPGNATPFTYMASVVALLDRPWLTRLHKRITRAWHTPALHRLGPDLHNELLSLLRTGLSARLDQIRSSGPPPSVPREGHEWWHLLHVVCRWTGARATDLIAGTLLAIRGPMVLLSLPHHKKRRFGRFHVQLPRALLSARQMDLLSSRQGLQWPVGPRPWRPMLDHESWRRGRVLELSLHMTRETLTQFMGISKALDTYLRGMPTAIQDRPQEWFQG